MATCWCCASPPRRRGWRGPRAGLGGRRPPPARAPARVPPPAAAAARLPRPVAGVGVLLLLLFLPALWATGMAPSPLLAVLPAGAPLLGGLLAPAPLRPRGRAAA